MKCNSYKMFFEVFANETRFKIIDSLSKSPKCVTDICEDVKEEQSKVSHNLKILTCCNFVVRKIDGRKRIYSLNKDTVQPIIKLVGKHVKKYCSKGKCACGK